MMTRTLSALFVLALAALSGCAMETTAGASSAVVGRPYFETWQATDGRHYFRLLAANHEIVLGSQGYSTRTAALNGVLSVLDNGEDLRRYEVRYASNGQPYFVLKAANGAVIGVSETYSSRSAAEGGIDAVARNVGEYLDWLAERTGERFDVFQGADGRWYFNLHAGNGEIVLRSQGYSSEAAALNGAFSVADHGVDAARYVITPSADGGFYFNLTAQNGQVIGTSEVYASRYNAERGRDAIIALLPAVELL
ncbi:MAG: YegP family protein [Sandaracinaceae bacterium]|nr:YegP family protein [Sandaracinaceae bacterium]